MSDVATLGRHRAAWQARSELRAVYRGNATIPYRLLARLRGAGLSLHLVKAEPFVGLSYLATFGFKVGRPLPGLFQARAGAREAALRPLARWIATRIFIVREKPA